MIEWSESQLMIRDAVRRFVESEIAPHVEELEHGDLPPYDILRKMYSAFGMDEMARAFRETNRSREVRQITQGRLAERRRHRSARGPGCGLIPIIELCRYCPGMVTALGVSVGLTASAILSKGTIEQKER